MTINEIIYLVRKEGAVKAANKEQADQIAYAGVKEGYNFETRKQGWSWIVEDKDAGDNHIHFLRA